MVINLDSYHLFTGSVVIVVCFLFTVNGDWSNYPETTSPPTHYFCGSKLSVWTNTADQVKEACRVTKKVVGRYFEQKHHDLVAQLVGQ